MVMILNRVVGRVAVPTIVERADDDTHVPDLAVATVAALRDRPDAALVATGRVQTIGAVRGAVKAAGLSPTARVKTYWDPRRTGLD